MSIDVLGLPQNVVKTVFTFLSDRSLMRMREISKLMRETVDSSMLRTRDTTIKSISIVSQLRKGFGILRPINEEVRIGFSFDDLRNFGLWKIYCRHLRTKLEIPEEEELDQCKLLNNYMNLDKAATFIESLKSVFERTQIRHVSFMFKRTKLIQACSKTFTRKTIPRISFKYNNRKQFMDLLKSVKASSISCQCLILTQDIYKFLLHEAEFMDEIYICPRKLNPELKIGLLVEELLRLKCRKLWINCNFPPVSIEDAEKFIKHFHRLGKNVSFSAPTTAEQAYFHCGSYRVRINQFVANAQLLSIDHFEDI